MIPVEKLNTIEEIVEMYKDVRDHICSYEMILEYEFNDCGYSRNDFGDEDYYRESIYESEHYLAQLEHKATLLGHNIEASL